MLVKFDFGSEALPYIELCLLKGKILSRYVYLKQRIEQGKEIFAYLPPDTTFEQRVKFLEGGIIKEPGSRLKTSELIDDFLGKGGNRYALFEHSLASPGDPWLSTANIKYFTHKSAVYFFLTSHKYDLEAIQNMLINVGGYPLIGILTSLPSEIQDILDRQEIDESILEKFAVQTQYIIVGAYDEETVLFWHNELEG